VCSASAEMTERTVARAVTEEIRVRRVLAVVVAAMIMVNLPACGRQVTGLGKNTGLVPEGQIEIVFATEATINTNLYSYLIVFNTQGNLNEPYALGQNSNYENWSFVIQVGGSNPGFSGGVSAVTAPQLYQLYTDPSVGVGYGTFRIELPVNSLILQQSISGGAFNTGFEVQFNRCLLDQPNPLTKPAPSPNPSSYCPPYSFINENWAINIFTVDSTGTVVDSLGDSGPSDTSVTFDVNTATQITNDYTEKPLGAITQLSNPAGEIAGIQVFSQPGPPFTATPTPTPSPTPTATP